MSEDLDGVGAEVQLRRGLRRTPAAGGWCGGHEMHTTCAHLLCTRCMHATLGRRFRRSTALWAGAGRDLARPHCPPTLDKLCRWGVNLERPGRSFDRGSRGAAYERLP